ncbi:MAG: ABC transporter permease [Acetobacteraceae bacterium]
MAAAGVRSFAPLLAGPAVIAFVALLAAPLGFLVVESLHRFSLTGTSSGFTGVNYVKLLGDSYYLRLAGETFKLACLASALCLVLATPLAWGLRLASSRVQGLLLLCLLAPLLISVVVRSFGWVVILSEFGLLNAGLRAIGIDGPASHRSHLYQEAAVLAGLVHVFLPFMALALYGSLQKIDLQLLRAARNLGANRAQAFLAVLPLSVPGMVAGVATVFALTAGSYVTVAVLGGNGVRVLAVVAYEQAISGMNWPLGSAIGLLLLVATTVALRVFQTLLARVWPVTS